MIIVCVLHFKVFTHINKEDFYSDLNIEDVTEANYKHEKIVCKYFERQNSHKYHDLHVQSDTILQADVFENF